MILEGYAMACNEDQNMARNADYIICKHVIHILYVADLSSYMWMDMYMDIHVDILYDPLALIETTGLTNSTSID